MLTAIAFSWFLSFGYVPDLLNVSNDRCTTIDPGKIATVAEIGLSANYHRLSLFTSIENYQYKGQGMKFIPFRADYKIGASLNLTKNCSIEITHECDHPVISDNRNDQTQMYLSKETQVRFTIRGGSQ